MVQFSNIWAHFPHDIRIFLKFFNFVGNYLVFGCNDGFDGGLLVTFSSEYRCRLFLEVYLPFKQGSHWLKIRETG